MRPHTTHLNVKQSMKHKHAHSSRALDLSRREFLQAGAGAAASLGILAWPQFATARRPDAWNAGQLAHVIPTARHERFLIKTTFKAPLTSAPRITVNGNAIDGVKTDAQASAASGRGDRHDEAGAGVRSAAQGMKFGLVGTERY